MVEELTYLSKKVNIPLFTGDTFSRGFTLRDKNNVPIDLGVGATARMVFRDKRDPAGAQLLEWSTANGAITITQVEGVNSRLEFDGDLTGADWASAEYDLEILTATGRRWTVMYGKAYFVDKQVAI